MSTRGPLAQAGHPVGPGRSAPLMLATDLGEARGGLAVAAAVGVAVAVEERPGKASGVLLAELGAQRGRGPTMLASASARELEESLREAGFEWVAARGRLCWLGLPATEETLGDLPRVLEAVPAASLAIVHLPARLWPLALERGGLRPRAGLLRADLQTDRALAALAVAELRERRLPVRVAARPLGRVASRRAVAGLEAGGAVARRVGRLAHGLAGRAAAPAAERGQALLMMLGAAFAILFGAALLAALGGALTGTARVQRAADLVALSAARSLRDDFPRLFTAPRLPAGRRIPIIWNGASTWGERPRRRARRRPSTVSTPTGCASRSPMPTPSHRFECVQSSPPRSIRRRFPGGGGGRPAITGLRAAPSGSRPSPRPKRPRHPRRQDQRAACRPPPAGAVTRGRWPTARARA